MTTTDKKQPSSDLPKPKVTEKPTRNLAWVWLLPLVAAVIGLSILWRQWSSQGPTITITFESAADLQAGKTQVKFRDVIIGLVTDIRLSENKQEVLVKAQLDKDAENLAVEGTQFWVVRPSVGVSGVSGLSTLFSGSYIEADRPTSSKSAKRTKQFVGLETAPPIASDRPGSHFKLRAPTLGSLTAGVPVYFLRIPVGVVTDYSLDPNGRYVDIDVFIDAPYDEYVNANTRFWDESGIDVSLDGDGLNVRTESLVSILAGGLAFATFGQSQALPADYRFKLYSSYASAERVPQGVGVPVVMRFDQSARGLKVGASIEFQGIYLGSVERIRLDIDPDTRQFYTRVNGTIYPARLGSIYDRLPQPDRDVKRLAPLIVNAIKRGMRAQLKPANLITGGMYVALITHRDTPLPADLSAALPLNVPTVKSETFEQLQAQITAIIDHIQKIPFEQLSQELSQTLASFDRLTNSLDSTVMPQISNVTGELETSVSQFNEILSASDVLPSKVDQSLREVDRTLRATRALIDELRQKPNSVLFGADTPSYSRESLGAPNSKP